MIPLALLERISRGLVEFERLQPAAAALLVKAPRPGTIRRVDFYLVDRDLNLDLADLEGKISESTRAVVFTHYFGFPQPAEKPAMPVPSVVEGSLSKGWGAK